MPIGLIHNARNIFAGAVNKTAHALVNKRPEKDAPVGSVKGEVLGIFASVYPLKKVIDRAKQIFPYSFSAGQNCNIVAHCERRLFFEDFVWLGNVHFNGAAAQKADVER